MPCCGVAPKQGRKPCVVIGIILIVLGAIFSFGFILNVVMGGVFDSAIRKKMVISSAADAAKANKIQGPADSFAKSTIYVYSLTNEAEVLSGKEPVFESVGPFVYSTKVGKVDPTFDAVTGKVTYTGRLLQEFIAAESEDLDQIITNIDPVYAGMFGAAQPTLKESGLLLVFALNYVSAIETYLTDYIVNTYYATEAAAYNGTATEFWTAKYGNMSANYNETIDSFQDILYAQWGGGAMMGDGVSQKGNALGMAAVTTSATFRAVIAGTLMGSSYLTDAQKGIITAAFSADATFVGLGIYQVMRLTGGDCDRLTIAEVKSIMACFGAGADCGLMGAQYIAADTGDNTLNTVAFAFFGLSYSNPRHACYRIALMSYANYMLPLANHLFKSRLLAEKGGVTDNILEKKTPRAIIEGYNSPTYNILDLPAYMAGFYYNHTTEKQAIDQGMTYEVDSGNTNINKLNKLYKYKGVTGFDYNGDGTVTAFTDSQGGCVDGSNFYPPNQAGFKFIPVQNEWEVFDFTLYKACTFKKSTKTYTMGKYEAPMYVRDDAACYGTDAKRASGDGYQSIRHVKGAAVYMTAPCMYGNSDKKLWKDDCPTPTEAEHGTWTAIDSLSGAPWTLQKQSQAVIGFDTSTAAFDMSNIDTTKRFPSFRMKTHMALRGKDKYSLLGPYDLTNLLKNTLSWVLTGLGVFFVIVGIVMVKTSVHKVGQTVPVDSTAVEVKPAAAA